VIDGPLVQALTNAVLALYGQPEPSGPTAITDIVALLNEKAAEKRWVDTGEGRRP
jgi:hypothetical protein